MGLYINDEVIWLNQKYRAVCFVDDIVLIVSDDQKQNALNDIGVLRQRLKEKGCILHPKKFYCQPYQHGLEFLGYHIKPNRIHLNNRVISRIYQRVEEFNKIENKYHRIDDFVSSINSYLGLLKHTSGYKTTNKIIKFINPEWWVFLKYNRRRKCIQCKSKYSKRNRLNKKYKLKLKHGKKSNLYKNSRTKK